jgi:hypothetical protein
MCLNSKAVINCDYCPRALCSDCIALPAPPSKKTVFFCLFCHELLFKPNPYMVSTLFPCFITVSEKSKGFYTYNGDILSNFPSKLNTAAFRPYGTSSLRVQGQFQMAAHSSVSNEGLTIIHFLLAGVQAASSPAKMLFEYISAFPGLGALLYKEVIFDLSNDNLAHSHAHQMTEMFKKIFGEW